MPREIDDRDGLPRRPDPAGTSYFDRMLGYTPDEDDDDEFDDDYLDEDEFDDDYDDEDEFDDYDDYDEFEDDDWD